jgi:hypothetical protein
VLCGQGPCSRMVILMESVMELESEQVHLARFEVLSDLAALAAEGG